MVRSIVAVIVGYLAAAVCVFAIHFALGAAFPSRFPRPDSGLQAPTSSYLVVMFLGFLPGVVGGLVAASIAKRKPLAHGAALGAIFWVLGAVSAIAMPHAQPLWYLGGLALLGTLGALAGARLTYAK